MTKCYGRLNFYMSLSSALSALIGPFILTLQDSSYVVLIALECCFILGALYCLCHLQEMPIFNRGQRSLLDRYLHIFKALALVFNHPSLWRTMFFSGLFSATTILLVWCFQPLMEATLIPIVCFGLIAFINHITRALFSINIQKIIAKIPLQTIQKYTCWLFIISTCGLGLSFCLTYIPLTIYCLLLTCVATGLQLAYTVAAVSYVHSQIQSENRSLISNLNFMIAAVLSSGLLFLFKASVKVVNMETALWSYAVLFVLAVSALWQHSLKKE